MAFAATADPDRFDEAVDWFDDRFPITEAMREQLGEYASERAWVLAGIAELDIVLDIFESIRNALEVGTSLDEWKASIRKRVGERWGSKTSGRLDVIFRNNVQKAYNRGRWLQMSDPDVVDIRPYWMFDSILDGRTSPICTKRNRVVLKQDDPFWDSNIPPLHHACRSSLRSLTEEQAKKRGVSTQAPDVDAPTKGFGSAPTQDEWKPDPDKYPPELWRIFEEKQAERA